MEPLGVSIANAVFKWARRGFQPTVQPVPGSELSIRISETKRQEEQVGVDPPVRYDNRLGKSAQRYTLRISRQWRYQIAVANETGWTASVTSSAGGNLGPIAGKLESAVASSVKQAYTRTSEEAETYEQTLDITAPAETLILVTITWKRIWQCGEVTFDYNGEPMSTPFRIVVGLSFDVRTDSVARDDDNSAPHIEGQSSISGPDGTPTG